MDVTRAIKEEKPGACKGMVGFSGDFENSDVIVPGPEFDEGFDVVNGNTVFLGLGQAGGTGVVGWLRSELCRR